MMQKEEEVVEVRPAGVETRVNSHGGAGDVLPPWEQHASVISLPRFDYRTPALLLDGSHSGFLITCPIKREKSATKEAISILEKWCHWSDSVSENLESLDSGNAAKKRKVCTEEKNEVTAPSTFLKNGNNAKTSDEQMQKGAQIVHPDDDETTEKHLDLSLVKLTKSGLVLLTFTSDRHISAVDVLSSIFHSMKSGDTKSPLWCHRIFPIQETCILKEQNLNLVVSKLVKSYIADERNEHKAPVKFAVGYNRRGLGQVEMKNQKSSTGLLTERALLEREQCFKIVGSVIKDIIPDSVVDLKSPEVVVLVELLPISGVSLQSAVAGVSVLPRSLVSAKPRLCVKPLISDGKTGERNISRS